MDGFQPKDQAESIALFRSQIIGPLTERELSREKLTEELEALSRKLFRTPRGHSARTYSVPTLERWLHKYKTEGLEGLKPKPRKDRGRGRHLTEEQKALLIDVRREHPSTSVPVILETLQDDGMLESDAVSATTVRRMFRERGLDRIAARGAGGRSKVRLRWQADRPGALWHADVCHGSALKLGEGQLANVRIHAILDDASRYIIAIEAMVFLLDEAHLLHQDTLDHLHILSNFDWDSKALLSLFLVGLPELEERLRLRRNRSLYSRIHCRLTVTPLEPDDTAEYIRMRLHRVGCDRELFASDALAMIHEAAAGSLRSIDRIATGALRATSRKKRKLVERDVVMRVCQSEGGRS